jgi:hypothetical protein
MVDNKLGIYKEVQYFRQLWLILVVSGSMILPLGIIAAVMITQKQNIQQPEAIIVISLVVLLTLVSTALIFILRLDTEISDHGISYRMFPFHVKQRVIPWQEIDKVFVRKYKPIGDYGGWGIRGLSKKNRAYNVSGDMGLQLILSNGNKILIGTARPADMEQYLKSTGRWKPIL